MRSFSLAFFLAMVAVAGGQNTNTNIANPSTVSVTGQGKVSAKPDMATISAGVVTKGGTANAALDENNNIADTILNLLMEPPYSISEMDMQTTSFQVYPEYNYTPMAMVSRQELTGYGVTNTLMVRVRNLDILGELLDVMVQAGSNEIGSVSFGFQNATELTQMAQKNAVQDAQMRAALYADAANVTLGKVISMVEPGAVPFRGVQNAAFDMAEGAGVPIASGEQDITATIQMVYEIEA
jgi:hypothetical protein